MHKTKLSLEDVEGIISADRLEEANELLDKAEQGIILEFGFQRSLLRKVAPIRLEQLRERILECERRGLRKGCEELCQRMSRLQAVLDIIEYESQFHFNWEKERGQHERRSRGK